MVCSLYLSQLKLILAFLRPILNTGLIEGLSVREILYTPDLKNLIDDIILLPNKVR